MASEAHSEEQQVMHLVGKDLQLLDLPAEVSDVEELHGLLSDAISTMLDNDFAGLINAFYRIDLNEKEVALALEMKDPTRISQKLATLVIEREWEKVRSRRKYSGRGS